MHGIVVYDDGRPATGITISTGAIVTVTDADGRFSLQRQRAWGNFVVLSRPSGYTANPWWYRLPEEVDEESRELRFILHAEQQTLPYEFIHLTDTHMTTPQVVASGRDDFSVYPEGSLPAQITTFLKGLPRQVPSVQSVMITGDLVDHGLVDEYAAYVEVIAASPLPTYVIPGNHDHMNGPLGSMISRNNTLINVGEPTLYEQWIGPRWYSFEVAGLHVVAMDWHSHELGIDHEVQNAWVKADLARLDPDTPYMLLFHDQPARSIMDELPWPPIATLSGHWHGSRIVKIDRTLHVNSPTTFFANLDYSPPAFRRITWDGQQISLRTETLLEHEAPVALTTVTNSTFAPTTASSTDGSVLWQASSAGAGHRHPVAIQDQIVFVGGQIENRAAGWVEAFDLASGELRWRVETASAVKTTPAVDGDVVVAAEVSGDLIALDIETGELRWRLPSSDAFRRFAWGTPTIANHIVYLGDQCDLRAVDIRTGEKLWHRTDLSPHYSLPNHAAPLVIGDLLVIGYWPIPTDPIGLDVRTGKDIWDRTGINPNNPLAALKKLLILGTAAYDPAQDAILMPAHSHTTALDRTTQPNTPNTSHGGRFSPATPLVTNAGYIVTVAGYGLMLLNPEDGSMIWNMPITGDAPFPMAAYSKTPNPVIAPPILVDGQLLIPGLDGAIRRFDLKGHQIGITQFPSPLAAPLTLTNDQNTAIAISTSGTLFALDPRKVASSTRQRTHR